MIIVREFGDRFEDLASRYELAGEVEAARQLRSAVAQMHESVRLRNAGQAGTGSVVASTGVPETSGRALSVCPPGSGDRWLSVGEVATRYNVSLEWVRRLCVDEVLVATRLESRGRPWLIEEESAEEFWSSRRNRG